LSEKLVRADGEIGVEGDFQKGYKMPSRAETIGEPI
jgi:hypothetical protein